jgi:hypothetical protein
VQADSTRSAASDVAAPAQTDLFVLAGPTGMKCS